MSVLAVTDATVDAEVLRAAVPVLVDFWGPGCASCRAMGPIVEDLADEHRGRLKVVTIDAHANPATATRFAVRGVPTFLLVKDGRVVQQLLGAVTRTRLAAAVADALRT
jgi:thioredoxin 1